MDFVWFLVVFWASSELLLMDDMLLELLTLVDSGECINRKGVVSELIKPGLWFMLFGWFWLLLNNILKGDEMLPPIGDCGGNG